LRVVQAGDGDRCACATGLQAVPACALQRSDGDDTASIACSTAVCYTERHHRDADGTHHTPAPSTPTAPTTPTVQATPMAPPGAPRPVPTTTAPSPGQVRILYEVHEGLPFHLRLERFLAVVLPLAAINVLIISQRPEWAIWSNMVYFFILGMWMPGSHLIGTIDDTEDYRDVALVMLMSLFCCGPVATLVLYFLASGLLALILKTDINWSLIGLLLAYTLARILFDMVLILIDFEEVADFVRVSFSFGNLLLLVSLFGGWLLGGIVRSD
jgi:hypothetical protein